MAKDPAFLFYPGDYLRDTQNFTAEQQVAYDRIMCEHMRNICVSKTQVNFFTKRLSADEKKELLYYLVEVNGGYQIAWVAESIIKRRAYSESRRENKIKKHHKICSTYDEHMENEIEIENENVNKDINNKGKEAFVLPDWIPEETWKAYLEIRNKKKAAKTVYALNLVIKELQKIKKEHGHNPVDVLNKSIKSGWTDVYPLKDGGNNGNKSAGSFKKFSNSERSLNPEVSERADAITREYLAKKAKGATGGSEENAKGNHS